VTSFGIYLTIANSFDSALNARSMPDTGTIFNKLARGVAFETNASFDLASFRRMNFVSLASRKATYAISCFEDSLAR